MGMKVFAISIIYHLIEVALKYWITSEDNYRLPKTTQRKDAAVK